MTAPPDAIEVARAWLDYAQGDLATAKGSAPVPSIPGWVIGLHAQQAIEKAIKGAMALCGVEPPRTHDLLRLEGLALQAGARVPLTGDELVSLARFAVEDRCPIFDAPRVSREAASELVPMAERAVTWLLTLVDAVDARSDL